MCVNLKQFTKMYFSCTSLSQHQIPNRRWTIGDSPEKDRVHLDIYVTGKDKYYHPRWGRWHASLESIYKEKVVMDTVIQFDDDGTNPLRDPAQRRRQEEDHCVMGYKAREHTRCDGFNAINRHGIAFRTEPNILWKAYQEQYQSIQAMIDAATKRPKRRRIKQDLSLIHI